MPQTIQQTGKIWKLLQLIDTPLILVAATWAMVAFGMSYSDYKPNYLTPSIILVCGMASGTVGRFGAWWFHG